MMVQRVVLLVAIVGMALGVYRVAVGGPPVPEETRIREAIETARKGVETVDLGEILSCVSERYEDGEYDYSSLRSMLAFGLRRYSHCQVVVMLDRGDIQVQGNTASANARIDAIGITTAGEKSTWKGTMRLLLESEPTRRALFFPDHRWRVVRIEGLGEVRHAFER